MGAWRGHFPITSFVLLELLRKAEAGGRDFSRAERVLFTACEFWAAVATRSLTTYLKVDAIERLDSACVALASIGAIRVADVVRVVLGEHPASGRATPVRELAADLENRLLNTPGDNVDQLIASYAALRVAEELPFGTQTLRATLRDF
jgi:hypothetical protein